MEKETMGGMWEGEDNEYIFHAGLGKPLYYTSPSEIHSFPGSST
jgi:hypothetical protein